MSHEEVTASVQPHFGGQPFSVRVRFGCALVIDETPLCCTVCSRRGAVSIVRANGIVIARALSQNFVIHV